MLKFSCEQVEKLSRRAEDKYAEKLENHLIIVLKSFGHYILDSIAFKKIVAQSIVKAKENGIESELEICVFAELLVTFGPNFLAECSWAADKIDPNALPKISLSALCRDAPVGDDSSRFQWISEAQIVR